MGEDVAGTANGGASCATAMIWCKPLKPQHTRGRSLANTALERYAGRLVHAHNGTTPSNECNLPSSAAVAES